MTIDRIVAEMAKKFEKGCKPGRGRPKGVRNNLEPFFMARGLDGSGYAASGHQRTRTGPFFPET